MKKEIEELLNSELNTNAISKASGVPYSVVWGLRHERRIEDVSLKNATKLADYYEGVLKMERTVKQEENLRKSTERMRTSENSKILSDAAFDLNTVFEDVQMSLEQRILMTESIEAIQKVSKDIAYDK